MRFCRRPEIEEFDTKELVTGLAEKISVGSKEIGDIFLPIEWTINLKLL